MTTDAVTLDSADAIARVTLNRPDKLNAIDLPMLERLVEVLAAVEADSAVRVVTITGAGKAFCAGADQGEMVERPASAWQEIVERYLDPIRIICRMDKPVIAAIGGDAVGGGFGLALSCDFRIAADHARFCAPFVKIGLAGCDMSAGYFLPRLIGLGRATDLMMTARFVDAEEAERIGLIHKQVAADQLDAEVARLAEQLAATAPVAMSFTKAAVRRSIDRDMAGEFDYEVYAQVQCLQTEDHREALQAFRERRGATFKGR